MFDVLCRAFGCHLVIRLRTLQNNEDSLSQWLVRNSIQGLFVKSSPQPFHFVNQPRTPVSVGLRLLRNIGGGGGALVIAWVPIFITNTKLSL
jgi:hypothetical protein